MTGRRALTIGCAVAVIVAVRSWVLPSSAPVWLRGASPFTWSETRAERKRCLAFANMIGSTHPATYYYDEDRKASPVMTIDRTVRAGDSLAFDGRVMRGRYLNYVFHCATANVRGHPGEHRSEIAEPWSDANDWTTVHAVEERLRGLCIDSAAIRYPTSRFSDRTLMLRPVGGSGRLLLTAVDTVYESEPQTVSCAVWVGGGGKTVVSIDAPTHGSD